MSLAPRALARPPTAALRGPALAAALLLPILATPLMHASTAADGRTSPLHIDPAAARRAGLAMELDDHPELPVQVVELDPAADAAAILDVAPDGASVAAAGSWGPASSSLILARADGGQTRLPMAGVLAATFAPDGAWIAAVDGAGQLWRISPEGERVQLAAGPLAGPLVVEADGAVLALAVSSVEAPISSRAVRIRAGAEPEPLADEELVYGLRPLSDGSLAVIAHRPSGTVLLRLVGGTARLARDLGPGAVNVSVSADAGVVAWEADGQIHVVEADGPTRHLGVGANPRLAADGSVLLFDAEGGTTVTTRAGEVLARLGGQAELVDCPGCRP